MVVNMLRIILIVIGLSGCGLLVWTCQHTSDLRTQREAEIKRSFGKFLAPEKETGW